MYIFEIKILYSDHFLKDVAYLKNLTVKKIKIKA